MSESDEDFLDRVQYLQHAHERLREADRDRLVSLARKGADWQAMKDERDVAKTGYQNLLAENELHGKEITRLRAKVERLEGALKASLNTIPSLHDKDCPCKACAAIRAALGDTHE